MDFQNLTKKNQEFIHIATNRLIEDGKSDQEIKEILEETVPTILEKQRQGIPARSFLGAPTAWAASFSPKTIGKNGNKAFKEKNTNPWLMWLDTSLLFIGMVSLLQGMLLFYNSKTAVSGLTALLALGFGGGASMYATYYFIYRHVGKAKSQRPSWFKIIAALTLVMLSWIGLYTGAALLPQALNPQLPAFALVVLGAIAFGSRYLLQRKYNIQSAMSAQQHS
ncbi:DUF1129 domain-containing protein [Streptococcus iniae]|uniref:DUF1129 domain-containing protein n=1 Tax=Streptococcus iniae TaxID=1346 RepID=UPI000EF6F0AE|nr:DUF1129 family protein [Streptococcus iniae]RLU49690.1 DUF1129 domain-containing protein [Streptococcus iniae]RLU73912.1 DUF1129 domain-containing protein [Streptococcus iniae]RLV01134.1 DUF1129 domain-containing protein [Streptococcus iniae]RLV01186.1 DUF1129 domain-containing protein [Streptococcus iniae]RLV05522.1 DUF1129 domain-containing protein [Streptococcus iniae]